MKYFLFGLLLSLSSCLSYAVGFMSSPGGTTSLSSQSANTTLANVTSTSAKPVAVSLPSCVDTGGNHLNYTNGTGFSCGTSGSGGVTLASGTYTPTLTSVSNITSISAAEVLQYLRVGNTVTVSGELTVSSTTPSTTSQLSISLPVSSNLSNDTQDCAGSGGSVQTTVISSVIQGNFSTHTCRLKWTPINSSLNLYSFSFTYLIN